MQVPRTTRSIGVRSAVAAIVLGLAVCGVVPASAESSHENGTGNMVFFKGGFMGLNSNRGGEFFTDCSALGGSSTCGRNDSSTGWYGGAGLDLMMTKDTWGAMSKTWVVGEIGLQFNRLGSQTTTGGVTGVTGTAPAKTQLTMLTIDVAPKIKFMEAQVGPYVGIAF